MHPEVAEEGRAARRLAHDTLVHVVRRPGALEAVRVAIPGAWGEEAFVAAMQAFFAERGWVDVRVTVVRTDREARLLSVVVA